MQVNKKLMHGGKKLAVGALPGGNGRNCHQSPQPDMGKTASQSGQTLRLLGGCAGLALLAADVHLDQNILHDADLFRPLVDHLQQLLVVH